MKARSFIAAMVAPYCGCPLESSCYPMRRSRSQLVSESWAHLDNALQTGGMMRLTARRSSGMVILSAVALLLLLETPAFSQGAPFGAALCGSGHVAVVNLQTSDGASHSKSFGDCNFVPTLPLTTFGGDFVSSSFVVCLSSPGADAGWSDWARIADYSEIAMYSMAHASGLHSIFSPDCTGQVYGESDTILNFAWFDTFYVDPSAVPFDLSMQISIPLIGDTPALSSNPAPGFTLTLTDGASDLLSYSCTYRDDLVVYNPTPCSPQLLERRHTIGTGQFSLWLRGSISSGVYPEDGHATVSLDGDPLRIHFDPAAPGTRIRSASGTNYNSPWLGSVLASAAKIRVSQVESNGIGKLSVDGSMQFSAPPPGAVVDPMANGIRLLMSSSNGSLFDVVIPGGDYNTGLAQGWKHHEGSPSWLFRSKSGVGGITKIKVKQSGETYFVKIRGKAVPIESQIGSYVDVAVQFMPDFAEGGLCGRMVFSDSNFGQCKLSTLGNSITCSQ